jgi:hypothetical protein
LSFHFSVFLIKFSIYVCYHSCLTDHVHIAHAGEELNCIYKNQHIDGQTKTTINWHVSSLSIQLPMLCLLTIETSFFISPFVMHVLPCNFQNRLKPNSLSMDPSYMHYVIIHHMCLINISTHQYTKFIIIHHFSITICLSFCYKLCLVAS